MRPSFAPPAETGIALLEALVAILIFSFGILAIMGLQANAIGNVRDAKYRSDAAYLANQIVALMWADDPDNNLGNYAFNTNGANCNFGGGPAAPAGSQAQTNLNGWLTRVANTLPGATADHQQILVDAARREVTVTVCWQVAQNVTTNQWQRHTVTTRIKGAAAP